MLGREIPDRPPLDPGNHLHLLVEAKDKKALSAGMKSFATRAARALTRSTVVRQGVRVRYHATQIQTARHARHALAYVLNNWRRHRKDFECSGSRAAKLDPYASALSFDGWTMRFTTPRVISCCRCRRRARRCSATSGARTAVSHPRMSGAVY